MACVGDQAVGFGPESHVQSCYLASVHMSMAGNIVRGLDGRGQQQKPQALTLWVVVTAGVEL